MIEATVLEWYEQKRRNPWDEGRRRSFGRDKRPPRQDGEVHAGPFRIRSFWPPGLDESFLAVDERPKGQNGQGQMVPGDGTFEENPHKIPRQIREKREIIGFIHPSFANEVFSQLTIPILQKSRIFSPGLFPSEEKHTKTGKNIAIYPSKPVLCIV